MRISGSLNVEKVPVNPPI